MIRKRNEYRQKAMSLLLPGMILVFLLLDQLAEHVRQTLAVVAFPLIRRRFGLLRFGHSLLAAPQRPNTGFGTAS